MRPSKRTRENPRRRGGELAFLDEVRKLQEQFPELVVKMPQDNNVHGGKCAAAPAMGGMAGRLLGE